MQKKKDIKKKKTIRGTVFSQLSPVHPSLQEQMHPSELSLSFVVPWLLQSMSSSQASHMEKITIYFLAVTFLDLIDVFYKSFAPQLKVFFFITPPKGQK